MLDKPREVYEERALKWMQAKAEELGVKGVACVWIREDTDSDFRPVFRPMGRTERDPDSTKGPNDKGTNYLSVVWAKIAEMVSTLYESGAKTRDNKFGEFGFRGGLKTRTMTAYWYTAFSGGTEDQDVEIALAGMRGLGLAK